MPPVAWDRLSDATNKPPLELGIITLGHVHNDDLTPLTTRFSRLEQLVLDIPPRDDLAKHRAEFNRAVDAATIDWLLIIREREVVTEALATEIAAAIIDAKARGFRIRSVPLYCGKPLRFGSDASEVRLFHRRYYLRYADKGQWSELQIQGTVVRMANVLESVTFTSAEQHKTEAEKAGERVSRMVHAARFARDAIGTRTIDANTLRYLWIESGVRRP